MKVFLLGCPGSGKSTVAGIIEKSARERGWDTQHIYDYSRLYSMFQKEEMDAEIPLAKKKFRPAGSGFDVIDFGVLETVLKQIAHEVHLEELNHPNKLFLIEFARQEYRRALHIFGSEFLRDTHVFYIKVGLELCIERVHQRAKVNKTKFDHNVSDEIMRGYYDRDDWLNGQLSEYLDYLQDDRIKLHFQVLENAGTPQELGDKVDEIVNHLIPELVTA
jgi:adenylate kinase family enzyme